MRAGACATAVAAAAATTKSHRARYQCTPIAGTTAASTTTREITSTASVANATNSQFEPSQQQRDKQQELQQQRRRQQRRRQHQQITNWTWPPGTDAGCSHGSVVGATVANAADFASCARSSNSKGGNINSHNDSNEHDNNINKKDQDQKNQTHRISGPINLLPPPPPPPSTTTTATSSSKILNLRHSNILLVRAAYKGIEYLNSKRHLNFNHEPLHHNRPELLNLSSTSSSSSSSVNLTDSVWLSSSIDQQQQQSLVGRCRISQVQQVAAESNYYHEYQELQTREEEVVQIEVGEIVELYPEDAFEEFDGERRGEISKICEAVHYRTRENSLQVCNETNLVEPEVATTPNRNCENINTLQQSAIRTISANNSNNISDQVTGFIGSKRTKPKHLAMATVRPISPQYQHTLDSAISLAKELASKNMADSGESSPKTPNSPDKKRFNFKLKHFNKSYSEASANIRDIESSISDEAKQAYKSLIERGQFNSSSYNQQVFSESAGRSFSSRYSPNARDYANDDFLIPTTPPATTSKFKYSTFSVKKSFF